MGTAAAALLGLVMACSRIVCQGAAPLTNVSPTVVLAFDDSGAFGPRTPGTMTAGWQEAIDYCVANKRDLTVKGGWGGQTAIYHVRRTIRIPASQDFRIDGGVYVLNWEGSPADDLLRIDSGMDCHYAFGILVYGGTGAALRIRPEHPVPIDGFPVFADSDVRASSIADPSPFTPGERKGGAGVVFDTEKAAIVHADFHFTAVLNFATCIAMATTGRDMAYCSLECGHLHANADRSLLLDVGTSAHENLIRVRIGVDQGAKGVRGVSIEGANNDVELVTRGGFAPNSDLIFAKTAEGNVARLVGRAPIDDIVSDYAREPSNRISSTGSPAPIRSVHSPPGKFVYTQRLISALVRVSGTADVAAALLRNSTRVPLGISRSLLVTLGVGDRLEVSSKREVTLQIVPQR